MTKWIYSFEEGSAKANDLLGGKGANLAEMSHLGLPVPPGFTITTKSCIHYLDHPDFFDSSLKEEVLKAVAQLEDKTGKSFSGENPHLLLVSVRSGAKFSMPGMMDTILNLGLNDQRTQLLAKETNLDFAYNCYRRLLQMFADVVYGIDKELFDDQLAAFEQKQNKKVHDFDLAQQQKLIQHYKDLYSKHKQEFPENPHEQLYAAIQAVFKSWNNKRARIYRELHQIPHDLGTAVNVQAMVFGNSDQTSGTGVCFTRNPATGEAELFGEFLLHAQGEDVVAGIRTPEPIAALKEIQPETYQAFRDYAKILENHYKDMQDIEFTIEKGKLYVLQTRNGKRTAKASLKIALDMVDQGLISKEEALLRVAPASISQLIHPVFEETALEKAPFLAQGLPASPGAATGQIVFTADRAKKIHQEGEKVILVRREVEVVEGSKFVRTSPSRNPKFDYTIKFDHPVIGEQRYVFEFSKSSFVKNIARARTFGFLKDLQRLQAQNLALGASLDNAVAIDDTHILNPEGLRFENEFVRHKILDAVGDLSLLGAPLLGDYTAFAGSHDLNHKLTLALMADEKNYEIATLSGELLKEYQKVFA